MLPPAFQNHLAQLATIGQTMHRMAVGMDLGAAVTAAREAINLLKSQDVQSALPSLDVRLRGIENGLEGPNATDLRRVISELSRLIQSLGASRRPFLAIVQNAPDQRVLAKPDSEKLVPGVHLQKASILGALERFWDRGEHEKARQLIEGIVLSAQEGNIKSRALLADIVCSERPTVSINIRAVADVLESTGWHEFTMQLIDPHHTLLIPGLHPSKINPHLISDLLNKPPAVSGIVESLSAVLSRKNDQKNSNDPWGLRTRAAQGLFSLTTPSRGEMVSVFKFWEILIHSWPVAVPALRPEGFGPTEGSEHRWDLYEDHLQKAFEIIGNQAQPRSLREATLAAVWAGGPARGPRNLCLVACSRTLDVAEKSPAWVWPIAGASLEELARSGFVVSERLQAMLPRKEKTLEKSHVAEPQRLIDELSLFTGEKEPHLRLVSAKTNTLSPKETLGQLTAAALELGTYGLMLEPGLIAAAIKKAVAIFPDFETLDAFRSALYPLHPAAAVTAWLDATGLPWPSHLLTDGHRPEAALALLRWLRDREKEPSEIQAETAVRYWELDRRLSERTWRSVTPKPLEWWHHRLALELSATLAHQVQKADETGRSHGWAVYARTHPEVVDDVRSLAKSPLPGTRLLAGQIQNLFAYSSRSP